MTLDEAIEIPEINSFLINTVLIEPLEKIINGLMHNEYKEIDILFLLKRKEYFAEVAARLFNIKINFIKKYDIATLNEETKSILMDDFNTLLTFFKKFN